MRRVIAALVVLISFTTPMAVNAAAQEDEPSNAASTARLSPARAKQVIEEHALAVLRAIKNRDMPALASFVHPRKGVRLSPYNYVMLESDRVLSRRQLAWLSDSGRRLLWGHEDASGDPIRMTFRQYIE